LILNVAKENEIDPSRFEVEITETTFLKDLQHTKHTLRALKDSGIRIAVDDFGTGYSSLAYLKRFPVDVLKIDRAFIHGIPMDEDDAAITRAIIAMADSLGLSAIAEGVETEEQAGYLHRLGCEQVQGFGMCRPLPLPELIDFISGSHES
jgi:EAL domain-containing protein (putative c-di-GMP-specific phosphodiesterase class I)